MTQIMKLAGAKFCSRESDCGMARSQQWRSRAGPSCWALPGYWQECLGFNSDKEMARRRGGDLLRRSCMKESHQQSVRTRSTFERGEKNLSTEK